MNDPGIRNWTFSWILQILFARKLLFEDHNSVSEIRPFTSFLEPVPHFVLDNRVGAWIERGWSVPASAEIRAHRLEPDLKNARDPWRNNSLVLTCTKIRGVILPNFYFLNYVGAVWKTCWNHFKYEQVVLSKSPLFGHNKKIKPYIKTNKI